MLHSWVTHRLLFLTPPIRVLHVTSQLFQPPPRMCGVFNSCLLFFTKAHTRSCSWRRTTAETGLSASISSKASNTFSGASAKSPELCMKPVDEDTTKNKTKASAQWQNSPSPTYLQHSLQLTRLLSVRRLKQCRKAQFLSPFCGYVSVIIISFFFANCTLATWLVYVQSGTASHNLFPQCNYTPFTFTWYSSKINPHSSCVQLIPKQFPESKQAKNKGTRWQKTEQNTVVWHFLLREPFVWVFKQQGLATSQKKILRPKITQHRKGLHWRNLKKEHTTKNSTEQENVGFQCAAMTPDGVINSPLFLTIYNQ